MQPFFILLLFYYIIIEREHYCTEDLIDVAQQKTPLPPQSAVARDLNPAPAQRQPSVLTTFRRLIP
jgi:hypothetical protein